MPLDIPYSMVQWFMYENLRQHHYQKEDKNSLTATEGKAPQPAPYATSVDEPTSTKILIPIKTHSCCLSLQPAYYWNTVSP